jgi:HlyD family secretion protein
MNGPNAKPAKDVAEELGLGQSAPLPRRMLPRMIVTVLAVLVMAALALWFARDQNEQIQYRSETVQRGNLTVIVTATGSLVPTNQVDVSIEISGTIRSVEADYNDRVKVGQTLARIDTTKLEAQMLQTSASLDSARAKALQSQASVTEAESRLARLERVKEASGGKVPSPQEIDSARATRDRARADEASALALVAQTQAALDANRTDLAKAVVHSPINGVVLKRAVETGQTVAAALQAPVLFTIAEDLAKMELQVDVDEADVGKVRTGQDATFTVDAYPDRSFPARITLVRYGSQTIAGVVTYKAVLKVDNSSLTLRPGMTATAAITVNMVSDALLVPNAALRFSPSAAEAASPAGDGGLLSKILPRAPRPAARAREDSTARQQRVWILRDGEPQPTAVTIGATNGLVTEIVAGEIAPGAAVIVDRAGVKR